MKKWINAEDIQPKHNGDVLMVNDDAEFLIGFFTKGLAFNDDGFGIDGITHWQELPAPPSYA
jgi:hypothetical protein